MTALEKLFDEDNKKNLHIIKSNSKRQEQKINQKERINNFLSNVTSRPFQKKEKIDYNSLPKKIHPFETLTSHEIEKHWTSTRIQIELKKSDIQ